MPSTSELYAFFESLRREIIALKIRPSIPSQKGNSGKVLTTNGYTPSWTNAELGGDTLDTVPTNGSTKGVQSNGVFDALTSKANSVHTHSINDITGLSTLLGQSYNNIELILDGSSNLIGFRLIKQNGASDVVTFSQLSLEDITSYLLALPGGSDTSKTFLKKDSNGLIYWGEGPLVSSSHFPYTFPISFGSPFPYTFPISFHS